MENSVAAITLEVPPDSPAPEETKTIVVGDIEESHSVVVKEQSQPAVLETISTTKPTFVRRSSGSGSSLSGSRNRPSYPADHTPSVSPRSINMETSVGSGSGQSPPGASNNPPETPGAPPMRPDPASAPPRQGHRRTASENLGQAYDHYYQYPPTQIYYNPNVNLSPKQNDSNGVPPAPSQTSRNRVRSWSGNQPFVPGYPPPGVIPYPPSPGMQGGFPPPQGYSPGGTPLIPSMADTALNGVGMPMMPQPPPGHYAGGSSSRRKRKERHRRVHSYSGVPSYGSAGMNEFFSPPPPPHGPPPPGPSGRNRSDFSPRTEFMKLTSGFRPSQAPTSPGPSPPHSYRQMSPRSSSFRGAGSYAKADEHMRVSFSPAAPLVDPTINGSIGYGTDFGNSSRNFEATDNAGAGEAVFIAQKTTKHRHKKSPSSRRMHMRQRSAQLFMEDVKGVKQNPACRDVFFLLLFLQGYIHE